MRNRTKATLGLQVAASLLAIPVVAHHAVDPNFDRSRTIEVEGTITEVHWQNPHIRFELQGSDAAGQSATWQIETNSVSIVSRLGLTEELVSPGTAVRVAGNPGRLSDTALWLTNMLMPGGEEILFARNAQARWSSETIGANIRAEVTGDPTGELGIFRTWTNAGFFWLRDYPLTPAAAAARADFDPIRDDPTTNCAPKGMPYIMEQPYPIEFVDAGERILLRLEEYDTLRTIYLNPEDARAHVPDLVGRSVGHWEGETLVVETSDADYAHFDGRGIPQSPAMRTVERFTLSDDGSRLNYEITVTDPAIFTAPVVMSKHWVWRPDEQVAPYNCTVVD